jgi:hypothetical protein
MTERAMKLTLCVDVNDAAEVAAVEKWRQTWGPRVKNPALVSIS